MALKEQISKLAIERNEPCVTISLNTHRTHPDNLQDEVLLKNLLKEAENRVIDEFGKRPVDALLKKIASVKDDIDVNYNLDSLHLFLSNDTREIIKSPWSANENAVHISDTFALRPLIKAYNRSEDYLIMVLSQGGVQLYEAINDGIVDEIRNEDFPFSETPHYNTHSDRSSDPKHLDDLVREFFNKVDKALVKVHQETGLQCVVVCTEDNYSRLMQVADKPGMYNGYVPIDYNNIATHFIASQTWKLQYEIQRQRRAEAIAEMKQAISEAKVLTDLQEIYQAAIDGRGELLIVHSDYSQPVLMKNQREFSLVEDTTQPNVIDDITSNIAWEVISKKGRAIFTSQDEIKELGKIVLKVRY